MNIAGTATIADTMPPTTTLGTYPIARNLDRLSGAPRGPASVELRLSAGKSVSPEQATGVAALQS